MEEHRNRRPRLLGVVGVVGVCGLCVMNAALAAPPERRLDLRLPVSVVAADTDRVPVFPSQRRSLTSAQLEERFSGLNAEISRPRVEMSQPRMGRLEEIARRMHREGVPLARLWESKSALVSLGLNQRGKPGLWIIQKIH